MMVIGSVVGVNTLPAMQGRNPMGSVVIDGKGFLMRLGNGAVLPGENIKIVAKILTQYREGKSPLFFVDAWWPLSPNVDVVKVLTGVVESQPKK